MEKEGISAIINNFNISNNHERQRTLEKIEKIYNKFYEIILKNTCRELKLGEETEEHEDSKNLEKFLIKDVLFSNNEYTELYRYNNDTEEI
jgi:predicted metal-dependent phosphoesterase TrpH